MKTLLLLNSFLNMQIVDEKDKGFWRKKSNPKLKLGESIFRKFIEQSSEGICLIDSEGIIIEWNKAMSEIFEVAREKYLNKPVWLFDYDYLPKKQQTESEKNRIKKAVYDYINNPANEIFIDEFEKEVNNNTKYIQYRIFPIKVESGKIFGRINIDVSERKAAEFELEDYKEHLELLVNERTSELQHSEARMRLLFQSIPMAYYSYDKKNRKNNLWHSHQIEALTGFKPQDFQDNPDLWVSRINRDDYSMVGGTFNSMKPNVPISCEYRWKDAKEHDIWIYDQAILIEEDDGKSGQIIGCFMDISERKEAEKAIIESERNYREIFNSTSDSIFIYDSNSKKIDDVNDTMLKMYRAQFEEAITADLIKYSLGEPPYTAEDFYDHLEKAINNGEHHFEWISRRMDNTTFWSDIILKPIVLNGEEKILAVVRDIDERKKAEEKIFKERSKAQQYLSIAGVMFISINAQGNITMVNQKGCDILGYTQKEIIGKNWFNNFLPKSLSEEVKKVFNKLITGKIKLVEYFENPIITKKGEIRIIAWHNTIIKDNEGNITGTLSSGEDITEGKKAEKALKESEEKYRLLVEGQTDLVVKIDIKGEFLFVSPSYCDLFGKTEKELIGKRFMPLVHKDDQDATIKAMENLYKPPYTCYVEHRVYTKHGWRWIAWSDKAVLNEKNRVIEIIGVGRDITYQKGVEDALRRSEDRFRSIVQQLSDVILIIDPDTTILYDTPSAKNILGYKEGYLIGKKGLDLVHPDDFKSAREKLASLLSDQSPVTTMELRMKHAEGRWIPLEAIGINMLKHPSINGMIITLRDISERKHMEKRILDAVIKTEEQERDRFAKNLHDDLGPLLSSIKMYVNSFENTNDKAKQKYIIEQLNEVVKEAITTTKEVSNDLSPHILNNYGLVSATESFIKKVPDFIKVKFESDLITERYSNTIENSFYRILKELINNTIKHAQADKIKLKLTENNKRLKFTYSDNGKGFDISNIHLTQLRGMGLSNIISRARSLNGRYEFQTEPDKGFEFKISIPIDQLLD
ncbi:hypothetical protein ES708_11914 [subsurface metagenome]